MIRSFAISSELKWNDLQRDGPQTLRPLNKLLLFESKNEWGTVGSVIDGAVRLKRERSMKQSRSTNYNHFNSSQYSVRCSLGSVVPFDSDKPAANHFAGMYGFHVLPLRVVFLLLLTPAVCSSSLFGKSWTTGFEMFDLYSLSLSISPSLGALEAAFRKVLVTRFTEMPDSLNETWGSSIYLFRLCHHLKR